MDDYIGRHMVEYSMEDLMALQVGQSKENGGLVSGGDGIYEFKWRITRLPDAEPNVGPVPACVNQIRESSVFAQQISFGQKR